ncbi:hypothetical protein BTVI_34392 [Pitangus sulphuratus]|nr:hypothetical protein BTVI_34392 [Pitangus sulphuratus]
MDSSCLAKVSLRVCQLGDKVYFEIHYSHPSAIQIGIDFKFNCGFAPWLERECVYVDHEDVIVYRVLGNTQTEPAEECSKLEEKINNNSEERGCISVGVNAEEEDVNGQQYRYRTENNEDFIKFAFEHNFHGELVRGSVSEVTNLPDPVNSVLLYDERDKTHAIIRDPGAFEQWKTTAPKAATECALVYWSPRGWGVVALGLLKPGTEVVPQLLHQEGVGPT